MQMESDFSNIKKMQLESHLVMWCQENAIWIGFFECQKMRFESDFSQVKENPSCNFLRPTYTRHLRCNWWNMRGRFFRMTAKMGSSIQTLSWRKSQNLEMSILFLGCTWAWFCTFLVSFLANCPGYPEARNNVFNTFAKAELRAQRHIQWCCRSTLWKPWIGTGVSTCCCQLQI